MRSAIGFCSINAKIHHHRTIYFQLKIFREKKSNCHKEISIVNESGGGNETREDLVASRRECALGGSSQLEIAALKTN